MRDLTIIETAARMMEKKIGAEAKDHKTCSMGVIPVPPAIMPMDFHFPGWYSILAHNMTTANRG